MTGWMFGYAFELIRGRAASRTNIENRQSTRSRSGSGSRGPRSPAGGRGRRTGRAETTAQGELRAPHGARDPKRATAYFAKENRCGSRSSIRRRPRIPCDCCVGCFKSPRAAFTRGCGEIHRFEPSRMRSFDRRPWKPLSEAEGRTEVFESTRSSSTRASRSGVVGSLA